MSLHGLLSVTIGVPNVGQTAAYYADFGLGQEPGGWFTTTDGGRQLQLVHSPVRRLRPTGLFHLEGLRRHGDAGSLTTERMLRS